MGSLFSSFNPETVMFGVSLSLHWGVLVLAGMPLKKNFFFIKSKFNILLNMLTMSFFSSLKDLFKGLISSSVLLFFLSMSNVILFSNIMGLLPYVFTSTSHLSITLSLSLPLWLGYMFISLFKQFNFNMAHLVPENTPVALMPLMVMIESISLIIRPFTLAVRLAANMIAGHLLLTLLGNMACSTSGIVVILVMIGMFLLMTLELAVSTIQMYVFTILSALYLNEHNSPIMLK